MKSKLIIKVLHIILAKKMSDGKKLHERISILNHQIQHFEGMSERYQGEVIKDLITDLTFYGWKDIIKDILKEVKK